MQSHDDRLVSKPQDDQVTIRTPAYFSLLLERNAFPQIGALFVPQDFVRYVEMQDRLYSKTFFLSNKYCDLLRKFGIFDESELNIWEDLILPKGWSCDHKFIEGHFISEYVLSHPWQNTEDNYRIIYKLNDHPVFSVSVYKFKDRGWDRLNFTIDIVVNES